MRYSGGTVVSPGTPTSDPTTSQRRSAAVITIVAGLVLLGLASAVFTMAALSRQVNRAAADLHTTDEVLRAATTARAELAFAIILSNVDREFGTSSTRQIDIAVEQAQTALETVAAGHQLLVEGEVLSEDEASASQAGFLASGRVVLDRIEADDPIGARRRADADLDDQFATLTATLVEIRDDLVEVVSDTNQVLSRISNVATFVIAFLVPTAAFFVYRHLVRRPREALEAANLLLLERTAAAQAGELVSHASNEVVSAILEVSDVVERGEDPSESVRQMRRNVATLDARVGELSTIVGISAGSHRTQVVGVALADVVDDAVRAAGVSPDEVSVDVGRFAVRADGPQLRQAMTALVDNARRHGGSEVAISAARKNGWTSITVADDGSGLPPEVEAGIFEDADLRGRRDARTGRLGFGLLLAQSLIESMGGTLRYARTTGWTMMRIEIPSAEDDVDGRSPEGVPAGAPAPSLANDPVS